MLYYRRSYSELKRLHLLSYLADPLYNHSAGPTLNDGQTMDPQSDADNIMHTSESFWCGEFNLSFTSRISAACPFLEPHAT